MPVNPIPYAGTTNGVRPLVLPRLSDEPEPTQTDLREVQTWAQLLFPPNPTVGQFMGTTTDSHGKVVAQWQTVTPGGGITQITSTDGSIIVTNPFGPITDLSGHEALLAHVRWSFNYTNTDWGAGGAAFQIKPTMTSTIQNTQQFSVFLTGFSYTAGNISVTVGTPYVLVVARVQVRAQTAGAYNLALFSQLSSGLGSSPGSGVALTVPVAQPPWPAFGTGDWANGETTSYVIADSGSGFGLNFALGSNVNTPSGVINVELSAVGIT